MISSSKRHVSLCTLAFVIALLFSNFSAKAQNLLVNPSFKNYTSCPNSLGEIDLCIGWRAASVGSTDFFHECTANPAYIGVPSNRFGSQPSASGSYIGFYTLNRGVVPSFLDQREYLTTSFPPLTVGDTFRMTIVVSLADSIYYASDGLGVYFTTYPFFQNDYLRIAVTPQVSYTSYGIISDNSNWVKLTKTFVADSAYSNLVIGNFTANAAINVSLNPSGTYSTILADSTSYYYVDSAALQNIHYVPPTSIGDMVSAEVSKIFPNPFSNMATLAIAGEIGNGCVLEIYDMQGKMVRSVSDIRSNEITIERGLLEAGLYYYRLIRRGSPPEIKQFLIQ